MGREEQGGAGRRREGREKQGGVGRSRKEQ